MTRVAWPRLAKRPRRGDLSQRTTRHRLYDDSYAVNFASSIPYGDAINYELIPAIERRFRAASARAGRVSRTVAPPVAGKRDLHHHFFPPVAKKRYGPFPPLKDYSPEKSIEAMGRAGIRTAFLSLPTGLQRCDLRS
jgi:hypothetical protein